MLRPIIYRASLAEMFIPYGDPNPAHYRKNVFDMTEVRRSRRLVISMIATVGNY